MEKIIDLIKNNTEENIEGKYFCSDEHLNEIQFSDIMDIVLLYISLQPDMRNLGTIRSSRFYKLVKNEWKRWISDEDFIDLKYVWNNKVGTIDDSAGVADLYMSYRISIFSYNYLLLFFNYPEELPGGWPEHRRDILTMVLPKWKREKNFQKINLVFNLAELICTAIRKEVAE